MPISLDFSGKLVLVTGGGRGIGLGITTALAQGGADVAITYTSVDAQEVAAKLSKEFGVNIRAFKCNVTDSAQVVQAVGDIEKSFGKKVDIGVCNAGISMWKDAHHNTDAEFQNIFNVNVFGVFYAAPTIKEPRQATALYFLNIRHFRHVPSEAGRINASKGAVTMLMKSLAGEWAPLGIRVNSVSPGYVLTDMIANPPSEEAKGWVKEWQQRTPVGQFATPEQIGNFVAVMLSEHQGGMSFLTGSDFVVDGGYTIF